MFRRPPRSPRPDPLFPYTTLFRSDRFVLMQQQHVLAAGDPRGALHHDPVLGAMMVHLQRQGAFRLHRDALDLEAGAGIDRPRSEEHTSELQSLMRISYAVFCLKKNNNEQPQQDTLVCTTERP